MSMLMGVAIEIGAVAAKTICKFWLKNVVGGEDLSSDLIDFFKEKTSNVLAQRQGRRLFEKIGDKISDEILPMLTEGSQLDEGERQSIALTVVESIGKAKLTNEVLLKRNLQPIELKRYIIDANPQVKQAGFSEDALYLYDRILIEVCTYIVDLSTQLPGFTEQTFIEVLQREDRIMSTIEQVLQELRRIREDLMTTGKGDRFEKEYREAVARNLDLLQLIGVDVSLPNRRHQLSVAYITLSVSRQHVHRPQIDRTISLHMAKESESTIVSVETSLAFSPRLLILGPAGSGKTTLLQWIAVRVATKTCKEPLKEWNDCLPFYIRLRRYGTSDLPQPSEFPRYAAPAIMGEMPTEWVHTQLRSGRAIILVDGIDEIAAARREEVHTWLRDLIETYPHCRFIVTSRPHAVEAGWMNHTPFDTAVLQDMTLADISSFIDHWHEAVKQELLTEEEKAELPLLAKQLKEHIRKTRAVRNLATNPLLCAMLCALNRERRRRLPVNRLELYQACSALLLERREKDRHIDLSDYPSLIQSQKERLLADIANWMTRRNLSETDVASVDASISRSLRNMPNIVRDITGRAVRCFFVERSGIIREPVAGQIDFAHRTFQEFFTALASVNSIKYLITHAHLDQWREVIILTAGLVRKAQCEQLIKGLLQRGDQEKEYRYQLHLLAVSCLETVIELGEGTRKEIEQRFNQLIPPKTMDEAKVLAAAGELALKHLDRKQLTRNGPLLVSTCAACVRTLALIGDDAALDMLEEYADDSRKMVRDELLSSWDKFERESYAKRVLTRVCKGETSLTFRKLSSLDGIQYLSKLTTLYLNDTQVSDLSPLVSLSNLAELHLNATQVSDLSPLSSLSNLATLRLNNTKVSDLSPIAGLSNLTTLFLSYTQVSDLSPIASLSNLATFWISNLQIADLSLLASLSNLTDLALFDTNVPDLSALASLSNLTNLLLISIQAPNLSPLASLSKLTTLFFYDIQTLNLSILASLSNLTTLQLYRTQVSDLSSLVSLSNLTTLRLSETQVFDLSPLASLSNLTTLYLNDTQVSDLSPLVSLSNLTELYLNNTQVFDMSPLASLSNLTTLYLSETQVSDMSPLASLSNLTTLDLSNTQVCDLSPLAGLHNLTTLYLNNTQVIDMSPLASLSNLTTLNLTKTQVSDMSPLASLPKLEEIFL